MASNKLIYLASPYSHPNDYIKFDRFDKVSKVTEKLIKSGIFVYAPITLWHRFAVEYELPTDFQFWGEFDKLMVSRSDEVHVLTLSGWEESVGVQAEIAYAKSVGIPVYYVSYEEIMR